MNDKVLFKVVFDAFRARYEGLSMQGTCVAYKGEIQFNTDGFNLLCNLKRLCEVLDAELL